ncbi:FxSxx-COOH system tetratricopeptide repeat protein [Actinoplanes sp. CA-142083]|uniref:FxSxx-COOH system tetratricopeptide repeat protein n=1 Tax=Actinoplanes sp. CA-142083 TaxID=3239903 RepID=UPI003D9041FE
MLFIDIVDADAVAGGARSAATGVNQGIVQTGDRSRAFQGQPVPLGRPQDVPAPWPAMIGLPKPPARAFVGRDAELTALAESVASGTGVVAQSQAVHGLGGVGKSELALQYAWRRRAAYRLVWWVTADSSQAIESGLAELAFRLHPDSAIVATGQEAARWAVGWLQAHPGWLLVLDNVEQRADVEPLLGQLDGGHVVITTRRDVGWDDITDSCLRVEVLDPGAAVDLLLRLSAEQDAQTAAVLAGELGCLPLALQQAGAYLRQTKTTMGDYLRDLRRDPQQMLATVIDRGAAERAVARVWSVTLGRIAEEDPVSVDVLNVLAWLAPDELPREVLHGLEPERGGVDRALGLLASYNMVTLTPATAAVHRLVQSVIRGAAAPEAVTGFQRRAVELLYATAPDDPMDNVEGWPLWASLLPHINALAEALPADHTFTQMVELRSEAAIYHQYQGHLGTAIDGYERVLAEWRRLVGDDHPSALSDRSNLAIATRDVGKVEESITAFERLLVDVRRVLGEDHRSTLVTRNQLAVAYQRARRVEEAIGEFERVLADRVRVLGDDHPDTLGTRHNLAVAYRVAGRVDDAITTLERVLVDVRRVLGEDHRSTLVTRNQLAAAYQRAGRVEEAIGEFERVLADRVRVLGDDHPDTLGTRHNLAVAFVAAGKAEEAIKALEQVLADTRRVLGDDHPNTLAAFDEIVNISRSAGRPDRR